ncbi:hypothetical protein MUP35_01800 [Patescibacteria group bacterium]|nr:hypothetical protein [Patescibacteria group bacterium]
MKKKIIISLMLTVAFLLLAISARAASPTPTATDSGVQEIRDKVKEIVQEKIKGVQQGQKAGFFGEISKITDSALTLQTNEGNKELQIATDAAIIQSGKKAVLEDLKTGSFAIAMGYLENTNLLDTKRLVIGKKTELAAREVAFGQVTDVSSEENILTIKNEKKSLIYTIEINNKTAMTKEVDGKVMKVKFGDIVKGDKLVAVGAPSENEHKIITAKVIRIISETAATASPTPSATATPEATPTP